MTIVARETVRAALERALGLDPGRDLDRAIDATAASLGLPREAVAEVAADLVGAAP